MPGGNAGFTTLAVVIEDTPRDVVTVSASSVGSTSHEPGLATFETCRKWQPQLVELRPQLRHSFQLLSPRLQHFKLLSPRVQAAATSATNAMRAARMDMLLAKRCLCFCIAATYCVLAIGWWAPAGASSTRTDEQALLSIDQLIAIISRPPPQSPRMLRTPLPPGLPSPPPPPPSPGPPPLPPPSPLPTPPPSPPHPSQPTSPLYPPPLTHAQLVVTHTAAHAAECTPWWLCVWPHPPGAAPPPPYPPPPPPPVPSPPPTLPSPPPSTMAMAHLSGARCDELLADSGSRLHQLWSSNGWKLRQPGEGACWKGDGWKFFDDSWWGRSCGRAPFMYT